MKKIFGLSFLIIGLLIGITAEIKAADMTLQLDSTDGSSDFEILDSMSLSPVAAIDSDGNMVINGGMRLDSGGTEYTTAENLIVDTAIGIGGTPSGSFLQQKASTTSSSSGNVPAGTAPTSPNEGDYWNDSTQKAFIDYIDGIKQHRVGCIFTQTADATVGNTTTETTLVGSGIGTATLPANFLVAGKTIRISASGYYSTNDPSPPNLQIRVRLGGIAGTVVLDTGSQSGSRSMSNRFWQVDGIITCRTTGGSGTVFGQGKFIRSTAANSAVLWDMENTSTTTIDTTAAQQIVLSATWNAAEAVATITCTDLTIEVLN